MAWEFEVWAEEFEGRPRVQAARGRYVTVHMGTGQVAASAPDGSRHSLPWPAAWVEALTGNPPA
jgi:acyl-CoA thioester hydrolase